jgi:hypothetical protein
MIERSNSANTPIIWTDLSIRGDVVRRVDVAVIDLVSGHELIDLDSSRAFDLDGLAPELEARVRAALNEPTRTKGGTEDCQGIWCQPKHSAGDQPPFARRGRRVRKR